MGLSASLDNALSGMSVSQNALEIVSRNVSNAGTPGYHVQSLSVIDSLGAGSIYARTGGVERAFNSTLQAAYTTATSDASYASTRLDTLNRLQTYFGKPGDDGSLDTVYASFQTALQSLSTSPDDYATRATAVQAAQNLSTSLNTLSANVQGLRQDAETQIGSTVKTLNQSLQSLQDVNSRLAIQTNDAASRAALEDQRDRLVSQVSEMVDVKATYANDGTVSLMTRSGVSILDGKAAVFNFQPAGAMTATSLFNIDPSKSSVGQLTLTSTSGNTIDLVQQKALQSGTLAALVNLRDTTLVQAQGELDSIAAGVSKAFSTTQTSGTAASAGGKSGYSLDLGTIRDGDDFTLDYSQGGTDKSLRVINSTTPTDYVDANGMRVVSVDMSGDASAVVSKLSALLGPSFTVSGSGSGPSAAITVLDDGAAGTTDVGSLTANATVTGLQTGAAAFSLFTDNNNSDFTGSLSGQGQQTGFAARIQVNSAVQSDNRLLVQYQSGTSLGDPTRANQALNQLQGLIFASPQSVTTDPAATRLGGTISGMISQTMDDVGNMAATASTNNDTQSMTMDSINQRLGTVYGVNVDDEMARLIQLQNAYSANARVISTVQDLMNQLMQI